MAARERRSNALWARGGGRIGVAAAAVACSLAAAGAATAAPPAQSLRAYVPGSLLSAIQQSPRQTFDVIVEGDPKGKTPGFLKKALSDAASGGAAVSPGQVKRQFLAIDGAEASLTGTQVLALAHGKSVAAILPNEPVQLTSVALPMSNEQKWPWSSAAAVDWNSQTLSLQTPTIAIVDSGIDASRTADFGRRVIGQVDLTTWSDAAWSDAAWSDAASADGAWDDSSTAGSVLDLPATPMTADEIGAAESALGIVDPACDPILSVCVAPTTP